MPHFPAAAFALLALLCDDTPVGLRPLEYEAARAAAAAEKRPLLVLFRDTGKDCARLAETTLQERKVRVWLAERVVAVEVDVAREAALARRMRVRSVPTFLFLDARGLEIDRIVGWRDGGSLRSEADEILKGGDALDRLRKRLQRAPDSSDMRLRLADLLAGRGDMEGALREYFACWDAGGPQRASALDEIRELGKVIPAALDGLAERAKRCEPSILSGEAGEAEVDAWLVLCAAAGSDQRVLWMYDALAERGEEGSALRGRLAPRLRDVFYIDRRYADLAPLVAGARATLEERIAEHAKLAAGGADAKAVKRSLGDLREATARDYEVFVGTKRLGEAALLADGLLGFDATVETYNALVDKALRADALEEAKAIVRRGRSDERIEAKRRTAIGLRNGY